MRIRRSCPIFYSLPIAALLGIVPLVAAASEPGHVITFRDAVVTQAEAAEINPGRAEIVAQNSFRGRQGVALRSGLPTNVGAAGRIGSRPVGTRAGPLRPPRMPVAGSIAVDFIGAKVKPVFTLETHATTW